MGMKFNAIPKERCTVRLMNKSGFIKELQNKLSYSEEKCRQINDILEDHFLIGKENKNEMIQELTNKLEMTEEEAERIYNTSVEIIAKEIKEKLKHPFRSRDD